MTYIIDGNGIASDLRDGLQIAVNQLSDSEIVPKVVSINCGSPSKSGCTDYFDREEYDFVGIEFEILNIDSQTYHQDTYSTIHEMNNTSNVNGIFLPEGKQYKNYPKMAEYIDPLKDVGGRHPKNIGLLLRNDHRYLPIRAGSVLTLIQQSNIKLTNDEVLIITDSFEFGNPLSILLSQTKIEGVDSVTIASPKSSELSTKINRADLLIVCVNEVNFVDSSMVTKGMGVIDASFGYSRTNVQSTRGRDQNIIAKELEPIVGYLSNSTSLLPIMRAMIMYNTVFATILQKYEGEKVTI